MEIQWVGWIWDREEKNWLSVCHNDEVEQCNRELIEYADGHGIAMRWTAMTRGNKPNWRME